MHTKGAPAAARTALYTQFRVSTALALLWMLPACISPNAVPGGENQRATGGAAATGSGGNGATGDTDINLKTSGSSASSGGKAEPSPVPECRATFDCAPPTPYCVTGHCVACTSNANCAGTGQRYCNANNACVLCLNDSQCSATAPYCSPEGSCVQCLSTKNCGAADAACDPILHRCVSVCASDGDCSVEVGRPFCNSKLGECVECVADEDCPPVRAHCLLAAGTCEKCATDADCPAATPHCDAKGHACAECVKNGDCRAGYLCQAGTCTVTPQ